MEAMADGTVHILAGSTEMGQGTNTIFAQIAAEALRLDCDQIKIIQPDTAYVPNSGPTVASRTAMIVGKLVETAALGLLKTLQDSELLQHGYSVADFSRACGAYIAKHGALKSFVKYEHPRDLHWDDQKYSGDAYGAYAWAVYVAEVSVDMRTAEVRVNDFVAVQEVGKVINPVLAAGQIEGGVAQGIGFALYENVVWQEGRMVNAQMTNYVMPTSVDLPDDSRVLRGNSVWTRARRRQGHRRITAGRHSSRNCKRDRACYRSGRSANSDYGGDAAGNAGGRACLSTRGKFACRAW